MDADLLPVGAHTPLLGEPRDRCLKIGPLTSGAWQSHAGGLGLGLESPVWRSQAFRPDSVRNQLWASRCTGCARRGTHEPPLREEEGRVTAAEREVEGRLLTRPGTAGQHVFGNTRSGPQRKGAVTRCTCKVIRAHDSCPAGPGSPGWLLCKRAGDRPLGSLQGREMARNSCPSKALFSVSSCLTISWKGFPNLC